MNSIIPLFIIFIPPILLAFNNTWNSRAMNGMFQSVAATYFYANLSVMLFSVPLLLIFGNITFIPTDIFMLVLLEVGLSIIAIVTYYHAIRLVDASVSQALYGAGAAAIPFLAMWIWGENIGWIGILGFLLIIASGVAASVDNLKQPRLNRGFFMILAVAALFNMSLLLEKTVVSVVGWSNSAFYHELIFVAVMPIFLSIPGLRRAAVTSLPAYKKNFPLFMVYGLFGAIALMTSHYVIGEVPLALKEGIAGTQPFFIMVFAWIFARFGISGAKEEFSKKKIIQKSVFFLTMLIGLIMLLHS